jgi:transcriptional regulator with XRE-family HTH domain
VRLAVLAAITLLMSNAINLRELRAQLGISQLQAAVRAGMSHAWYRTVELQPSLISPRVAAKLAALFGGEPSAFLGQSRTTRVAPR